MTLTGAFRSCPKWLIVVLKRCISILFCLVLLFSLLSLTSQAEETTVMTSEPQTVSEAVTVTEPTSEPSASVSDPDLASADTWIVFGLALLVGISLGKALSFWKW